MSHLQHTPYDKPTEVIQKAGLNLRN